MRAMLLNELGLLRDKPTPLQLAHLPDPIAGEGELLIKVHDLRRLPHRAGRDRGPDTAAAPADHPGPSGRRAGRRPSGSGHSAFRLGDRVGVAWIFSACGRCDFCLRGEENLCDQFRATGRDAHGGYAELMTVPEAFAYRIPDVFTDAEAAPLLCAGAIGYRSLRLTGLKDGQNLGLTGFGALGAPGPQDGPPPISPIPGSSSSPAPRRSVPSPGSSVRPGPATPPSKPPRGCIASSIRPPPGPRSSRRSGTSNAGGRLVINAIRKEDSDKDALLRLDYPDSPLVREGDQERRQRHAVRCPRIPAIGGRDPASSPRSRNMPWRTPTGRLSS